MNMSTFYVVMRDKESTHISKRHPRKVEAEDEAKRLCRKEGGVFFVLRTVTKVEPKETPMKVTRLHQLSDTELCDQIGAGNQAGGM